MGQPAEDHPYDGDVPAAADRRGYSAPTCSPGLASRRRSPTVMTNLPLPPWAIMVIINLTLLVLGTFMDAGSMIVIVIPIFLKTIIGLGYDPVWFGIVVTIQSEIAAISPPVGIQFVRAQVGGARRKLQRGIERRDDLRYPDAGGDHDLALSPGNRVVLAPAAAFQPIGRTSARFSKFVIRRGTLGHELRKPKGTSNSMILVPLVDLKFLVCTRVTGAGISNRRPYPSPTTSQNERPGIAL